MVSPRCISLCHCHPRTHALKAKSPTVMQLTAEPGASFKHQDGFSLAKLPELPLVLISSFALYIDSRSNPKHTENNEDRLWQGSDDNDRSDGFGITICNHITLLKADLFFNVLSFSSWFLVCHLLHLSPTPPQLHSPRHLWPYARFGDGGGWCWHTGKRQGEQEWGESAHRQSSELLRGGSGSPCSPSRDCSAYASPAQPREKRIAMMGAGSSERAGKLSPGCLPATLLICLLNKQIPAFRWY